MLLFEVHRGQVVFCVSCQKSDRRTRAIAPQDGLNNLLKQSFCQPFLLREQARPEQIAKLRPVQANRLLCFNLT